MQIVSFVLQLIGFGVACFLITAAVTTWIEAGRQQQLDQRRYGRYSSRWQIALEILKIRKVR